MEQDRWTKTPLEIITKLHLQLLLRQSYWLLSLLEKGRQEIGLSIVQAKEYKEEEQEASFDGCLGKQPR